MIKKFFITLAIYPILPFVTWWVRYHEKSILQQGRELSDEEIQIAKKIGIQQPAKVRVLAVNKVPTPVPEFIERFLQKLGYPAGNASGMCMRYGIFIKEAYTNNKSLITHELVHTHQFERLGGLWGFLKLYLQETILLGYIHSPLEKEATAMTEHILNNTSSDQSNLTT